MNEVQGLEPSQSSKDISSPVSEEVNSATEVVVGEVYRVHPVKKTYKGKKTFENKSKVKWPEASEKAEWEAINTDLNSTLERMKLRQSLRRWGHHL